MPRPFSRPVSQKFSVADALNRGIAFLKEGKRPEAEKFFLAILQGVPAHPDARHFLGVLRFQQGRADEALELLQGALRATPRSPALLSNLGMVMHALGKYDAAIGYLDRSLELQPNAPEAHFNRGNALRESGRQAEALASYERAIALGPRYVEALNGKAGVLLEQGKWAEVEACLRQCIAINPRYADAQVGLGLLLLQLGRDAEAAVQAGVAGALQGQDSFPHHTFGVLLARCGLATQAQQHLKIALARDPEDRQGAALLLAGVGGGRLPDRLSPAFVERLYGKRAPDWDRMMVEGQYRGAQRVADTLVRLLEGARADILDAGCGTGLVGVLLRDHARSLDGVDLSAGMLACAAAKDVYSRLEQGDLVEFLGAHPGGYDAITCAATLIHFGDLLPPLRAAHGALRDGGWLVFTLFADDEGHDGFRAGSFDGYAQGGCYAHGIGYVETAARATGFDVVLLEKAVHEHHYDREKMGIVAALRRPPR
ncbi:MAG: tetratricopeptide repeat protein [Ramlibacter sp.]